MKKILVIQTAYIGDVILMTGLVESLAAAKDNVEIDVLVRLGNEELLKGNPHIHEVFTWDKKKAKAGNFFKTLKTIRKFRYDLILNLHRFLSSGLFTLFAHAGEKRGFSKNPLSIFYSRAFPHNTDTFAEIHEIERNFSLVSDLQGLELNNPRLFVTEAIEKLVSPLINDPFICIAPGSVWPTKQLPAEKWVGFLRQLDKKYRVYLLGAKEDAALCDQIILESGNNQGQNLAGKLSLQASAALMQKAVMNFVLDSAPLHLASAMNAPVAAVFCSTTTGFGFGPLSDSQAIIEVQKILACRPCGIHGKESCPEKHFNCGNNISVRQLLDSINNS